MSKILLALALAALLFLAYLTAIRPAFLLVYGICLLFVVAWARPRLAARRIQLDRTLDAGKPTIGEPFEELFTLRKPGRLPAPWVEIVDMSRVRGYQPGRVV